jgi:DNA repair ATPase RecN
LIFDEVDVGISGAVAEVVGQKLKQLSAISTWLLRNR